MKTYLVGGALRDRLLGLPVSDRDWLVVGATPEEMTQRGYLPVGRDFPVFLHPQTREEYALARTERKSAPGYRGFTIHAAPDVTLEQDLARRDLTINSIALPAELAGDGGQFPLSLEALVDPFNGQRDLRDKVLRHVTDAFREDPVRILRVARFAARFHQFGVAPETMALMREMVDAGEVDALVPERVWQELARGLMEARPSRMFAVLHECGALERLLPELDPATARMRALDRAAQIGAPLPVRFACVMRGLGPALPALCERWRVPIEERDLALLVDREGHRIDAATELDAAQVMDLLERCDAIRKPQRFEQALLACECGVLGERAGSYAPRPRLAAALAAARAVATDSIARDAQRAGATGPKIGDAIRAARVAAVASIPRA
ncbi:multifunctional CCA tRNA nucleotidyl transferase/2'3'-cyclic phosphodiesterase/2'nucleotidase/phosphatase [Variovorax sp. J22G21]|uniref:multifunctional CCA tRNA nucleotidyl transferase/2'3'-cyclic phosphodiesterase/2'nucleotidase/phosphatase n=1 Tax=Variovorax fucosicus TaxID=3053517 RepID=UPI002577477C|nr:MULTISPECIES: multifunctional CCA tRNA nucleotidyl transferase/2'3'-cyclic phosphodiesterase/2'nucleotidase/phosphatase [unclassified Variovorax]MDM0038325.1 multifunctional CCA tRNA nucleotidyl transferase/2'3'-cyclic phosphodiesterase/2'nucleotidase/phosphatase [Variovorax sp. J22R193]MDM0063101.1 multifunctional CCA tRNA nucleotidyl transferase/2'3'-cyclic phosphodiesterase/2'nucleotidase/phosphatase [Variovorax sp. J22G21]